jgi:hypothetical protein
MTDIAATSPDANYKSIVCLNFATASLPGSIGANTTCTLATPFYELNPTTYQPDTEKHYHCAANCLSYFANKLGVCDATFGANENGLLHNCVSSPAVLSVAVKAGISLAMRSLIGTTY